MARYCVNHTAQANGDHEVHKQGCTFWPAYNKDLGEHAACRTAVAQAKQTYRQSNGCYFCSRECHTQ
jgi:hypothetical protein